VFGFRTYSRAYRWGKQSVSCGLWGRGELKELREVRELRRLFLLNVQDYIEAQAEIVFLNLQVAKLKIEKDNEGQGSIADLFYKRCSWGRA
jgi:hypothetical protein